MESEAGKDLTHVDRHSHTHTHRYTMLQSQSECYEGLVDSHAGILDETGDDEVKAKTVNNCVRSREEKRK